MLISAPRLGVYYFCRWLCLSVCHKLQIDSSFLFLDEIEPFWPSVLHNPVYKSLLFDFLFRPPNVQNWLPKICKKSPISRLVWQIDRRCLHLQGVFGNGRFNGTMQNVVRPTLVAMATKFKLKSAITRLVWHIDRICLRLPGGFGDGRFNGTMQNVVGPTLVAKIWHRRGNLVAYRLVYILLSVC